MAIFISNKISRLAPKPQYRVRSPKKSIASEKAFASYLDTQGLLYKRDYHVSPGDFDFRIESHYGPIYCDVKEIRDADSEWSEEIRAHFPLRDDIRRLRKKYKDK